MPLFTVVRREWHLVRGQKVSIVGLIRSVRRSREPEHLRSVKGTLNHVRCQAKVWGNGVDRLVTFCGKFINWLKVKLSSGSCR